MLFTAPAYKTLFEIDEATGTLKIQTWAGEEASVPMADLMAACHYFFTSDHSLLLPVHSRSHGDAEGILHELLPDMRHDHPVHDDQERHPHLRPEPSIL